MQLLTAINYVLRAVAQPQVDAATDENANIAKNVLERERRAILSNGYPFNRDKVTLQVDADDRVPIDRKFLKVRFRDDRLSTRDDPEKQKRYVWDREAGVYVVYDVHDVEVVFDITDIALIPEQFARWIACKSAEMHWYNTHGAAGNGFLRGETNSASALAINSLPSEETNVHGATQWRALQAVGNGSGGAAVRVDSNWIHLGD